MIVMMRSFIFEYCELPTISGICKQNGGELRQYHQYTDELHGEKFEKELTRHIKRPQSNCDIKFCKIFTSLNELP